MKTLGDDLKINLLPSPQKSFDSMFEGFEDYMLDESGKLHEVTEVSDTGEILDVNDLNDEELGKLTLKVKAKVKLKGPKISLKSLAKTKKKMMPKNFNKLMNKVKSLRTKKKMGPPPAKRHVLTVKSGIIHAGILAGTNTKLAQIHALLKKNAVQKKATSEHKAIVKKTKHKNDVLKRLSSIENKLGGCSVKPKRRNLWLP